jgi:iron(III) transport system ATP-binding protein
VHLRAAMEEEFARFHRTLGTTMFYITHDQAEAMALADRIAVMDHGVVVQLATPSILHSEPATPMVAQFIGEGMVVPASRGVRTGDGACEVEFCGTRIRARCRPGQQLDSELLMNLRLDDVSLAADGEEGIAARISRITYRGGYRRLELMTEAGPSVALALNVRPTETCNVGDLVRVAVREGWIIPDARPTRSDVDLPP